MSKQRDLVSVSQGASGDPLFIDTANNRVGVGTAAPTDIVHIKEANTDPTSTQLLLHNANVVSGTAGIAFQVTDDIETTGFAPKAAILYERTATNGRGVFKFMNDNVNDTNPFSAGDEVMRITNAGLVGIGTSSPSATLHVAGPVLIQNANAINELTFSGSEYTNIYSGTTSGFDIGTTSSGGSSFLRFLTENTERVRIASTGYVGFAVGAPTVRIHLQGGTPSDSNSGIAAAWNVHSDYRLKENVVEFSGASSLVSQLRPVKFSWVGEDQSEATTAGFIAHEMAEVAPYSVIGEKDAVNEDGSIKSQAADYSKLVPLLTAALQEALQKIEALETRITALETN